MTGDADVAGQAFVPGLRQRRNGAAGAVRDLPLVGLDQVVQLDQVDVVDAEPFEGPFELDPGAVSGALARNGAVGIMATLLRMCVWVRLDRVRPEAFGAGAGL